MSTVWTFDSTNDGFPYPSDAAALPENSQEKPYPLYLWRITPGTNSGYPYFLLQPPPAPVPVLPVPQQRYIQVFDMEAEKSDLQNRNGLAILTPSSCEITEVLNGEYSLRMTHPIDPDGKWEFIREENILRALGQLFTIKTVTWHYTGAGSGEVEVYAEHIFYQIADPWIMPFSEPFTSNSCYQVMLHAMTTAYHHLEDQFHQHEYAFSYASDWEWDEDYIFSNDDGRTVVDLLIGSGGITDVKGGELFRDNFFFRIDETMKIDGEGTPAPENAFDIRIGRNLSGISLTTDLSTLCTYYRGDFERSDGSWGWFAWAWKPEGFVRTQFPHHVVRSKNYSYDDRLDWDTVWERFQQDVTSDFKKNCRPVISYEIDLADVSRNPDFQEQNPDFEYKPGYTGRVYDERLGGAVTLKITETTTDAITGDVLSVTIGSRHSFTRNASYPVILGIEAEIDGGELPLVDADGYLLADADGCRLTEVVQNGI